MAAKIKCLARGNKSRTEVPATKKRAWHPTPNGKNTTMNLAVLSTLTVLLVTGTGEEYPDGPLKDYFQQLERPDNHLNPSRKIDQKSQFCCGIANTVKTKFKVEPGNEKYPEDRWYAWLNEEWRLIPPEKIVPSHAPDGQAYLFLLANTIQCFRAAEGRADFCLSSGCAGDCRCRSWAEKRETAEGCRNVRAA
jgi:hypothetical protein